MPKQSTKWACGVCSTEFGERDAAAGCETKCCATLERERFESRWAEAFPCGHKDDDRYERHCVECGKLLIRYETLWDGHRNERGDIAEHHDRVETLGGLRCPGCTRKFRTALLRAYEQVATL